MGLSASQARLLSITARLSDNELHSQQIANAKVRLADQTQQASADYIKALDSTKLVFTTYDANGEQSCVDLTPGLIYTYSPLKNQYGISNASGQILVSSKDCANYESSANMNEFLEKYGITINEIRTPITNAVTQQEWTNTVTGYAQELFGDMYTRYVDMSTGEIKSGVTLADGKFMSMYVDERYDVETQDDFDNLKSTYRTLFSGINSSAIAAASRGNETPKNPKGLYGDMLYSLEFEIPDYSSIENLKASYSSGIQDLLNVMNANYSSSACYSDVQSVLSRLVNKDGSYEGQIYNNTGANDYDLAVLAIEKNLSDILFAVYGSKNQFSYSNADGSLELNYKHATTASNMAISGNGGISQSSYSQLIANSTSAQSVLKQTNLKEIYAHVVSYIVQRNKEGHITANHGTNGNVNDNNIEVVNGLITDNAVSGLFVGGKGYDTWDIGGSLGWANVIISQYNTLVSSIPGKLQQAYNSALQNSENAYQNTIKPWKDTNITPWVESCHRKYNEFTEKLNQLKNYVNTAVISDTPYTTSYEIDYDDPMAQWYINLWHRMNGESEIRVESNTAEHFGTLYKQLDDNLLSSPSWLKFALEQGVVTLEKVQFVNEAEDITGLEHTKWQSIAFSSAADIHEVDDEKAIAKAEAEYTKKLNEIEAKDKKYDSDIKKLDTEHNALKTEYESVQTVISKNVERSFKAFS